MRAPSDQFYYDRWMRDTNDLSLVERGAWITLLAKCWYSDPRGEYTNDIAGYARLFGCTEPEAEAVLNSLIRQKICNSVTDANKNITVISRYQSRRYKEQLDNRLRQDRYREKHQSNATVASSDPRATTTSTTTTTTSTEIPKHLLEVWPHFVEMRKKIRAPLTEYAVKKILAQLEKHDKKTQVAMIDQSIERSWRGIFEIKTTGGKSNMRSMD